MNKLLVLFSSLMLLAVSSHAPVFASNQDDGRAAVKQAALYDGADRHERLVKAAKKEGEVMIYTSMQVDDIAPISAAFEKKYGIKVKVWRGSAVKALQRVVAEARAGHYEADLVETNGPEMEALHREKILQKVKSPYQADLIPQALTPHGEWTGTRLNIYALAYNTGLVKKADLPKSYYDLLDPKWKGKLGIEATNIDWFAGVVTDLGEAKGLQLFRDISAKNGFSVRIGNTLLAKLVAIGEVPMGLTIYNYKAEQMKKAGAPIDWFVIPPAVARPNGIGVTRHAAHPNAAVLFFDFMLNEAQPILLTRDFVPTSTKVDTELNKMPLSFVNSAQMLDEHAKWSKLYQEITVEGSK